jgi:hypothetical protein
VKAAEGTLAEWQFVRKALARFAHQRHDLLGRQRARKHLNELGQEWDVRLRQKLLDFWCQLEDSRRPGGSPASTDSSHDAVAFHASKLRSDRVRRKFQFRCNVVNGVAAALEECDDPATAGIKKLLPEHVVASP